MSSDSGKRPWESRTIVMNAAIAVVGAVSLFFPPAAVISAWLGGNAPAIAVGWSVLNIFLRFISKDEIQLGN